jgi:hypothetical protein
MKKKEDARLAVLREYDRWAKDHPNDAKKMGGYVFFGYLEKERPDLLGTVCHLLPVARKSPLASSRRSIEGLTLSKFITKIHEPYLRPWKLLREENSARVPHFQNEA